MSETNEQMLEEGIDYPYDYIVMMLSCAFFDDLPFDMETLPLVPDSTSLLLWI